MTIRGDRAHDILERGLKVKEMELKKKNFSESGIIYIMYMIYIINIFIYIVLWYI